MELGVAIRKRARASGGGSRCSAGGPDRLSALPDCLLHVIVIMSFMKARQAVQTCVLAKRWRHLWHSVPGLDIDFDEFKKTAVASYGKSGSDNISHGDRDRDKNKDKYKDWEDFAVNLMHRRNIAQLDSFRLHIVGDRAPEFVDTQTAGWLRRAMKYCIPGRASRNVGLRSGSWRLKRLHLCHVLLDNHFMKHVRSVCRSLEDLRLDDCSCEIKSITSHTLKTLVLKNCRWLNLSKITSPTLKTIVIDGLSSTRDCVLVIFAPSVAYLCLAVHVVQFRGGISINEVPSLAKASIHLRGHIYNSYSSEL
jgi:hypothetical protein